MGSCRPSQYPLARYMRRALLSLSVALLLLAGSMAAVLSLSEQSARAGDGLAPMASTAAAISVSVDTVERIALKLTPGARLIHMPDGCLTVVESAKASPTVDTPGLPLVETDKIDGLEIHVLEPSSSVSSYSSAGLDLNAAVQELRRMPGVLWAEISHPVETCRTPNDPWYAPTVQTPSGQWGVVRVGLPEAWDVTTGSAEVIVAIIDSGLNPDIVDFSGRIVSPYSVLTNSSAWPAWQDNHGHGSAVAGVAVARGDNGVGIAGAAWDVKIMPVKIAETGSSDDVTLAAAIGYAVDHGADVINVSYSGSQWSRTQEEAVAYALSHDVVVVAAAGNDGVDSVGYPAAIPGVIAVGATSYMDARWLYSNTGTALDLVAPGYDVISYSRGSDSGVARWQGTSFSAPLVAGVAALMRSVNQSLSAGDISTLLNQTADDLGTDGWDQAFGWGLLDAEEAVALAMTGGATTTTKVPISTTTTTVPPTTTSTSTTSTTLASTTTTTLTRFSDVSAGATPYWAEINELAGLGIVSGYEDGLFHPDDQLKRQQFAKLIVLAMGYPVGGSDVCSFTDVVHVPGELYPYHYVAVAWKKGITLGTAPGHYSPYRSVTRAQLITMVTRAAGVPEPRADYKPPFINFSSTHYPYARRAAAAGLLDRLEGIGPDYDFLVPATRGEVCALLYSLLER